MNSQESRVYAVVPVFNRIGQTLLCIECLKRQSHPDIRIIIVDGGSTDGTPEIIIERHPDVCVISGKGELWWGSASQLGIEAVLAEDPADSDFVLMVNNDTEFGPDIAQLLIETSRKYNAVVGSVVMDSEDGRTVIDGGVTLDWSQLLFSTVKKLPAGTAVKLDCDVLPGRCTLVPIKAIRHGGNVDGKAFPHYLADYEFTYRLKRQANTRLVVDYRARVFTRVDPPSPAQQRLGLSERWRKVSARRSKSNFMDHLRFIWRHSPPELRRTLTLRFLLGRTSFLWHPAYRRFVRPAYRALKRAGLTGPSLVTEADCHAYRLSAQDLCRRNVLQRSDYPEHFSFSQGRRTIRLLAPEALPLYWRSWHPLMKMRRWWSSRRRRRLATLQHPISRPKDPR